MKTYNRNALLLTATITPHSQMPSLMVQDSEVRFKQYCEAFEALVQSGAATFFNKIVICENSGFPMERFDHIFRDVDIKVIYASVPKDSSNGAFGRGFSEMTLIDRALAEYGSEISDDDLLWKLTGRYQIRNLQQVIGDRFRTADMVVNMRRYPKKWADLYLFAFNKRAWNKLALRLGELKTPEIVAETIMYRFFEDMSSLPDFEFRDRFNAEPHVVGIRGWDQRQYDSGRQKFKRYLRQCLRVVAPSLKV